MVEGFLTAEHDDWTLMKLSICFPLITFMKLSFVLGLGMNANY